MHADVGEEFLAGILQAGTKDIDHIVDNEKAVVIVAGSGIWVYPSTCPRDLSEFTETSI